MHKFANDSELSAYARRHVGDRVNSLEKDVTHCLQGKLAPFPALLYCFSTIDLLGALLAGRADRDAPTKLQSFQYMKYIMGYSTENVTILINLFRHKLVHLAQPNPVIQRDSEVLTWKYHHNDRQYHLRKEPLPPRREVDDVPSHWHIPVTHEFHISIMDFATDIKDSVKALMAIWSG